MKPAFILAMLPFASPAFADEAPLPPVKPDAVVEASRDGGDIDESDVGESDVDESDVDESDVGESNADENDMDVLPPARPDDLEGEPADGEAEDFVTLDPVSDITEACFDDLAERDITFTRIDPIDGDGACGVVAPARVTRIGDVELQGPATLNCAVATALTDLVETGIVPAAKEHLDAVVTGVAIGSSYVCRPRNSRPGAKLSEHGFANGVDLMAFAFEDRERVRVASLDVELSEARFLADIRAKACERFTTVLGPGSDASHANHFHLDLRQRKNDYRICQ